MGIHFSCWNPEFQISPDLFLGKPGDLHNLFDAAALGSRPQKSDISTTSALICSKFKTKILKTWVLSTKETAKDQCILGFKRRSILTMLSGFQTTSQTTRAPWYCANAPPIVAPQVSMPIRNWSPDKLTNDLTKRSNSTSFRQVFERWILVTSNWVDFFYEKGRVWKSEICISRCTTCKIWQRWWSQVGVILVQSGGQTVTSMRKNQDKHLGVSKNSGTPKWMVYKGKPY